MRQHLDKKPEAKGKLDRITNPYNIGMVPDVEQGE